MGKGARVNPRRDFLEKVATAAAGAAVLGAVGLAQSTPTTATNTGSDYVPRYGFVIDLRKCIGCDACTVACKAKNGMPPGVDYARVIKRAIGEYPNVSEKYFPVLCMQCENPPCVQVCPVEATYRLDNGITVIDYDRCIGCRYCIAACPYDARHFDFGRNFNEPMMDYEKAPDHEYGIRRIRGKLRSPILNVR